MGAEDGAGLGMRSSHICPDHKDFMGLWRLKSLAGVVS